MVVLKILVFEKAGDKNMSLIDIVQRIKEARGALPSLTEKVVIIFIDMTGSTDYKDKKGVEEGIVKTIIFNLNVTEVIKKKGEEYKRNGEIEGYEICKYIGDEVMAYIKGKNSSKAATEIAINIQNYFEAYNAKLKDELEKYKPRIGIDWGEIIFARYSENLSFDPYGLIVDRAARIVRLAKPQQILISEDVETQAKGVVNVYFSEVEKRKFKGIKEEAGICEVIWKEPLGIKFEEEPSAFMLSADAPTVYQFIKDENLLVYSKQIDLCLYTYETLASHLRYDLEKLNNPLRFRVLIRHPQKDPKKESNIKTSINIMAEIMYQNPRIRFDVRFYDEEPLLRAYVFHRIDNDTEGLLGMYKYDPKHPMKFVGAEYNDLIVSKNRSLFERQLLNIYKSRLEYLWDKLSVRKAVIFDLDGVIIDSMPIYYEAWREAFKEVGVNINENEVYQREGEKAEITAREVYKKFKNEEPSLDLIGFIVKTKRDTYKGKFKLRVFPGIPELLTSLKEKNVKLALVTGSVRQTIQQIQEDLHLFQLFDVVVTGEDTRNGKPAPDPYNMAVEKLGISPVNCYVIENGPLGIRAAVRAGLICFAVKGTSPLSVDILKNEGALFVYNDVEELRKHLIWVDQNIPLIEFLKIFERVL